MYFQKIFFLQNQSVGQSWLLIQYYGKKLQKIWGTEIALISLTMVSSFYVSIS